MEAIEFLTAANRLESDPKVEAKLAKLRQLAAETLPKTEFTGPWPPPLPDSAPGLDESLPIPEIDAHALTIEALRRGVIGHGAVIARGALTQAECDMLIEGIDNAFGLVDGVETEDAEPPWFQYLSMPPEYQARLGRMWVRAGGGRLLADSPRNMFRLLEIYNKLGLQKLVTEYLGERPAISACKATLRRVTPKKGDVSSWHQDGAFLGTDIRALNIWLALSDCGEEAPGMDMIPRRFEGLVEPGSGVFKWDVGTQVIDRLAVDTPVVRPQFKAGDLIFFDEMYLHRTAIEDSMTKVRYAIENWCFAPSAYPEDQIAMVW